MKTIRDMRDVAVCFLLFVSIVAVFNFAVLLQKVQRQVSILPNMLDNAITREGQATRQAILSAVTDTRNELVTESIGLRIDLDGHVNTTQDLLDRHLTRIENEDLAPIATQATATLKSYQDLAQTYQQIPEQVANAMRPYWECKGNGNCWPAGITATLGGAKMAFGETAQAARRIDAFMPEALQIVKRIGDNSNNTAAASARVMSNLAAATKPLPRWFRVTVGVGAAAAPMTAGAMGAAAAAGAFR